ncbi:hypothetical protein RhiJN_28625 [Ceratobasidium sp. AG-Ba]|nr:hypothetical protein RhiJN_28625 [Ceratobasidium sp. AG-Ba]
MEPFMDCSYTNDEERYLALGNNVPLSQSTSHTYTTADDLSVSSLVPAVKLGSNSERANDSPVDQLCEPVREVHPAYLFQSWPQGVSPPLHTFPSLVDYWRTFDSYMLPLLAAFDDPLETVNLADLELSPYGESTAKTEIPQPETSSTYPLEQ